MAALAFVREGMTLKDGRYEAPAPWKFPHQVTFNKMSQYDSYGTAHKRLVNLGKKMDNDARMKDQIFTQIEKLIAEGYVEQVPEAELDHPGWYLPIHPVYNPKKPNKVRLTQDAAAKTNGKYLNDWLCKGADLTNRLVDVLLQARLYQYLVKGDIRVFFHRVRLRGGDRDAFRFVFYKFRAQTQIAVHRFLVWLFVSVSSSMLANRALSQCAQDNKADFHQDTSLAVEDFIRG